MQLLFYQHLPAHTIIRFATRDCYPGLITVSPRRDWEHWITVICSIWFRTLKKVVWRPGSMEVCSI